MRLVTPLVLAAGRGVVLVQKYQAEDLVPQAQHKVGWNVYHVTEAAWLKIQTQYQCSQEILFD